MGFDGLSAGDVVTKHDYAAHLGYTPNDFYGLNVYQRNVADQTNDYMERVFIWNSMSYKLGDETTFHVNSDGTRVIENLSVVPLLEADNFDFNSDDAGVFNTILAAWTDPWNLGREVSLEFTGSPSFDVYDEANFQADVVTSQSWSVPTYEDLYTAMANAANALWDDGSTRLLDSEGRIIRYGSIGDDQIESALPSTFLADIALTAPSVTSRRYRS